MEALFDESGYTHIVGLLVSNGILFACCLLLSKHARLYSNFIRMHHPSQALPSSYWPMSCKQWTG